MEEEKVYISVKDRNIYLNGDISKYTVGITQEAIIELNKTDNEEEEKLKDFTRKPINIFINSWGGSVSDMFGLIDIIDKSKTPIHTYNNGICSSAGLDILVSGHRRFGRRNSTYLYHQTSSRLGGEYQRIKEDFKFIERWQKMTEDFYLNKTKMKQDFLDNIRDKKIDYYFFSNEALELGCIDEII